MPGLDFLNADAWSALLLASALKGALVVVGALLVTRFMVKSAASARHVVLVFAFIAALAMPLLLVAVPGWHIPVLPEGGLSLGFNDQVTLAVPEAAADAVVSGLAGGTVAEVPEAGPSISVGMLLLLFWAIGAFFVAARWAAGVLSAWVLTRRAQVFANDDWEAAIAQARSALGIRRSIQLRVSPHTRTPMTWGIFRPVILLPDGAAHWSADRRTVVSMHELAHVRRLDGLTQLFAQAACVIHWFNPFVWKTYERFLVEREHACDDFVLTEGALPSSYAQHLLDIARGLRKQHRAEYAMAPMAQRSQIEERLRSILNDQQRRDRLSRGLLTVVCVLVFAMVWPVAAISFVERTPQRIDYPVVPVAPEAPLALSVPLPPAPPVPPAPPSVPPAPAPLVSANLGEIADTDVWMEVAPSGPRASGEMAPTRVLISADFDRKKRSFQAHLDASMAYEMEAVGDFDLAEIQQQVVVTVEDEWSAHATEAQSIVRRVEALARGAREWASSDWIEDQAEMLIALEDEVESEWASHWKEDVSDRMPLPTVNPDRVESETCARDLEDNKRRNR